MIVVEIWDYNTFMNTSQFFIKGKPATGEQAEMHFMNWALALEQEHNYALIDVCNGNRCALNVSKVFQVAAYPRGNTYTGTYKHCASIVYLSGVYIKHF